MSRPRYWWYGNVLRTIAEYPRLKQRVQEMSQQQITPGYSPSTGGGRTARRTTEDTALRALSSQEYREYEAITAAITKVSGRWDGQLILAVVAAHSWNGREHFENIGWRLHVSERTAKRAHQRFVYAVAHELGYQD